MVFICKRRFLTGYDLSKKSLLLHRDVAALYAKFVLT
nr:MAG TPA: hypothetical protein [Caudoviricetes sp.]